jgi:hypothetical protein
MQRLLFQRAHPGSSACPRPSQSWSHLHSGREQSAAVKPARQPTLGISGQQMTQEEHTAAAYLLGLIQQRVREICACNVSPCAHAIES